MFPREIVDLLVEAVDPSTEDFCSLLFVSRVFWLSARAILFRHTTLTFRVGRRPNRSVTLLSRVVQGDPPVLHLIKSLSIVLGIDSHHESTYDFVNDESFCPLLHHLQTSPIHTLHVHPINPRKFPFSYIPPNELNALNALRSVPSLGKLVIEGLDETPATLVSGTNRDDPVKECILKDVAFVDNITFSHPAVAPVPQGFKPIYPIFQSLTRLVLDHTYQALEVLFPLASTKGVAQIPSLPSLISLTLCFPLMSWAEGEEQLRPIIATLSALIPIAPRLQAVHIVENIFCYPTSWQESGLFEQAVGLAGVPELQFSWNDQTISGNTDTETMFASMTLVAEGCLALRNLESLGFTLNLNTYLSIADAISAFVDEVVYKPKGSLQRHGGLRRFELNIRITLNEGSPSRGPEVGEAIDLLRASLKSFTINDNISFEYGLDIVPT